MCRLSRNLGASTSWNPKGLFRPVMGLLYLYLWNVGNLLQDYRMLEEEGSRFFRNISKHILGYRMHKYGDNSFIHEVGKAPNRLQFAWRWRQVLLSKYRYRSATLHDVTFVTIISIFSPVRKSCLMGFTIFSLVNSILLCKEDIKFLWKNGVWTPCMG
jgi:hypothetical protein